ncbi:MAG: class I SAM-dependent rRNA methyltransferase [Gammaproteobacteria bacterium]|nr:class I SAM-dependent rRNA methyltransferase [Gammaproteobacteria bacterium]MDE2023941.1 class I SAM-dependent rRNA methyltransferase [Gammaproteobacteria bacterium]MDE2139173.1 class I SAM-dependent rRNA methyltransferase [Gammaproteobacteria bacterium]MDE2274185.1 class I SAM-dependent rRNA methyltransferase [Gammaproteobacteria bacterium]
MSLPPLILKRNEDRRLRAGHLWVFSNEVDTARVPLTAFAPGDAVEIRDHGGGFLGSGYVNPNSLICARILSRDEHYPPDRAFLVRRLNNALALRARLYPRPFYRLLFGESDGLPGLVVDRYGEVLVAQITTAGMERMQDDIVAALVTVLKPTGILWRNDVSIRELEGLPLYADTAYGVLPERVIVEEHGRKFEVALAGGQKTGWFFDQHDNRGRLARYVPGRRVLDVFSYVGAWAIQALAWGAREALCVDSSVAALALAEHNAALNGVRIGVRKADAFDGLRALHADGEKFDVVILDPPAFVKRKKDLAAGRDAYRRLNQLGMQLLAHDGLLISCSCSHHLPAEELLAAIQSAARHVNREVQLLERSGQAADHPVHPAIPETGYLKAFFVRVFGEPR